jgi:thioredoxin-like negative regulator of GroEL
MKINREPLPVLDEEILRRDHEFWRQYGTRTVGDWITPETSVKEICDFAEKVYLRRDLDGFKGDPKFARDDNAQKAFSKLRGGIAGIYAWRLGYFNGVPTPPQYVAKDAANQRALATEADFAFKQSFAMCPYSAETVFRYVNFLFAVQRPEDALLISETCLKLDPENAAIARLVFDLRNIKPVGAEEQAWKANSNNFQAGYRYAGALLSQNRRPEAIAILDSMIANPVADAQVIVSAAEMFRQMNEWPRIEPAMLRLTQIMPQSPEAWFDLAGVRAMLGKNAEALQALEAAIRANDARLRSTPQARDLRPNMMNDPRFERLRGLPEFQRLLPPGNALPVAQPPLLPPPQAVPQAPN